jgi:predicted dinucleotide-binding enzyme
MHVTIAGTGDMARGLAIRFLDGGNEVVLLGAERADAEALARDLAGDGAQRVGGGAVGDDLRGELLVLAVPYAAAAPLVSSYGRRLEGVVIVDATNPFDDPGAGMLIACDTSAAEELAALVPRRLGVRVLKAFNTVLPPTLVTGRVGGIPLDVFIAGDDVPAKATLRLLVEASGMRPVDAGPLARALELEGLALLHVALQDTLGTGFRSAVKILSSP